MQEWRQARWYGWVQRYGLAELAGTAGSYAGYHAVALASGSTALAAYGAAVGENIGFYGVVGARDFSVLPKPRSIRAIVQMLQRLVAEFGTAELFDFLIFRPGATWLAVRLLGPAVGVLIGKIVADAVFYTIAVTAFERLRRSSQ